MARPPNADAGATQARVLGAALDLFSESGAPRVSIRDIAKRAGVTLATVHHYFGTKDELYSACIEAMYAELEAFRLDIEPAIKNTKTPEELVERTVRRSFRF